MIIFFGFLKLLVMLINIGICLYATKSKKSLGWLCLAVGVGILPVADAIVRTYFDSKIKTYYEISDSLLISLLSLNLIESLLVLVGLIILVKANNCKSKT